MRSVQPEDEALLTDEDYKFKMTLLGASGALKLSAGYEERMTQARH
jgi:hypothetical protein